jgi:biopolymer transport protein ExbD
MARKSRKYGDGDTGLNITSMMDMFTIVLVFLIKQMDTEGNLMTQADNLKLPYSTSKKSQDEVALTVVVDRSHVLVDNQQVVESEVVHSQDSLLVGAMVPVLEEKLEEERAAALAKGEEPDEAGNVIVQLDKNLEYDVMYKVMATCGWAGYSNIAFAVLQKISED